jgi:hypothetical protein
MAATAGIIRYYERRTSHPPMLGLWESSFAFDWDWFPVPGDYGYGERHVIPNAPSWSWIGAGKIGHLQWPDMWGSKLEKIGLSVSDWNIQWTNESLGDGSGLTVMRLSALRIGAWRWGHGIYVAILLMSCLLPRYIPSSLEDWSTAGWLLVDDRLQPYWCRAISITRATQSMLAHTRSSIRALTGAKRLHRWHNGLTLPADHALLA